MTWRRHLTTVRASVALWVLALVTLAARARTWVAHRLGRGARIPAGVHMLVGPEPDDAVGGRSGDGVRGRSGDVTIDLTQHDHAVAGSPGR